MRLFTGLALPTEIEAAVARLLDALSPVAPQLTWSPIPNLHITTKFIGEWPEARLADIRSALERMPKPAFPFAIAVKGVGLFPDPQQPRTLYLEVEDASQGLHKLARDTGDAVAALGVAREDRRYSPHVTLARARPASEAVLLKAVHEAVAKHGPLEFGSFAPKSFYLYSSSGSSVYTQLAEFPLQ